MILAANRLSSVLGQRLEVIIAALVIGGVIFELIRRKRLQERYAILWLLAGLIVLVLALWRGLLTTLSHAAGIYYPPAALFAVAFLFVLVMLLHFSIVVSRLSDQNKVLAQRLALLRQQVEGEAGRAGSSASADHLTDESSELTAGDEEREQRPPRHSRA